MFFKVILLLLICITTAGSQIISKEMALEKVVDVKFYSIPSDVYILDNKLYMIDWGGGFIVNVTDNRKKSFIVGGTNFIIIIGSAIFKGNLIVGYKDSNYLPHILMYDYKNDSLESISDPNKSEGSLSYIIQIWMMNDDRFIEGDGIVFSYAFSAYAIINSDTFYIYNEGRSIGASRIFLVDTILVCVSSGRDFNTYYTFGYYVNLKDNSYTHFLEEPANTLYLIKASGYIYNDKIFIAGNGTLFVFSLPGFNLLYKKKFGYQSSAADVMVNNNGDIYLTFASDEDFGNFGVLYKLDSSYNVVDSIKFSGTFRWSGFKFYNNNIYLIMYDAASNRTTVYKIKDRFTYVDKSEIPTKFALYQNYPNPFNPLTTISYDLPVRAHVKLTVYNILGQEVVTLVDGEQEPDRYNVKFDASGLPSGVYFYTLQTPYFTKTNKMVLVK
jgi:hypothetical protein